MSTKQSTKQTTFNLVQSDTDPHADDVELPGTLPDGLEDAPHDIQEAVIVINETRSVEHEHVPETTQIPTPRLPQDFNIVFQAIERIKQRDEHDDPSRPVVYAAEKLKLYVELETPHASVVEYIRSLPDSDA